MKIRMLVMGLVLAVVASVAVPAAALADTTATGETEIGGTLVGPSILVTPPTPLGFGTFKPGLNGPLFSSGAVTAELGSTGVSWDVVADDEDSTAFLDKGYMRNADWAPLTNRIEISKSGAADTFVQGCYGLSWDGDEDADQALNLYVQQTIVEADTLVLNAGGEYTITFVFTGTIYF